METRGKVSEQEGNLIFYLFLSSPVDISSLLEREREREIGIKPSTQVCALTRDQTLNLLVYGTTLQPTEPHSQGEVA